MSNGKKPQQSLDPLATLTNEAAAEMEKLSGDLDASYEYLDTLEDLGLDVSRQRVQLDTARKIRDAALKLFKK
jgi:hypothetical protein